MHSFAGECWFHILDWFDRIPLGSITLSKCPEGSPISKLAFLDSIAIWSVRNA